MLPPPDMRNRGMGCGLRWSSTAFRMQEGYGLIRTQSSLGGEGGLAIISNSSFAALHKQIRLHSEIEPHQCLFSEKRKRFVSSGPLKPANKSEGGDQER